MDALDILEIVNHQTYVSKLLEQTGVKSCDCPRCVRWRQIESEEKVSKE